MTPEGKVKRRVTDILKKMGAYYFYPATGGYGRSGVPDIIACLDGVFLGIECKAGKNSPTELQKRELSKIREALGVPFCINESNIESLEPALRTISTASRKALNACISGAGHGVLVALIGDKVGLHGFNIDEEDAMALLRMASRGYDSDEKRTLQ